MKYILLIFAVVCISVILFLPTEGTRSWSCVDHKCVKDEFSNPGVPVSLGECKSTCLQYGGLWPKPTGDFQIEKTSSIVNLAAIKFQKNEYPKHIDDLIAASQEIFFSRIRHKDVISDFVNIDNVNGVNIFIEIYDPSVQYFYTGADESYKLQVSRPKTNSDKVIVNLTANTFFGFRHGLETLSQLFFFDDIQGVHKMLNNVSIEDKPVYTHRGIVLDTARSFIPVDIIKRILDVMAASKLNTFHWHISDSQSFPYESVAYPELSKHGAYSKQEVYTQLDIKSIVSHAQSRGIRIIPESNGPSHVGEGWVALGQDMVTCFNWIPWKNYCVEPPCGHFDPTNEKIYEVLGELYKEYVNLFHSDMFHLAGDEVDFKCWSATGRIVEWMKKKDYPITSAGFFKLWGNYLEKVLKKLKATKTDPHPQAIIWTSTMTKPNQLKTYLNPQDYVIQIWTFKNDSDIKNILENKFRVIFSNYDELYLDCGGPTWVSEPGENWCAPYKGWQIVYDHSPTQIVKNHGFNVTEEIKKQLLGSEAAIWTEQIDKSTVETRLWPRAAALGERLWSDPEGNWKNAQYRMNHFRERIAKIAPAELLQPQWCYQNDGFCA